MAEFIMSILNSLIQFVMPFCLVLKLSNLTNLNDSTRAGNCTTSEL